MHPDEPAARSSVSVWVERGLALGLTLAFSVALGLRVAEPPEDTRTVQFTLLGLAAVLAAALVVVRRAGSGATGGTGDRGDDGPVSR